jgi:hypothetical protein
MVAAGASPINRARAVFDRGRARTDTAATARVMDHRFSAAPAVARRFAVAARLVAREVAENFQRLFSRLRARERSGMWIAIDRFRCTTSP